MTLLRVQTASVRYGRRFALKEVDFTLQAGEIVALLGPSGAGKSTLLSLFDGSVAACSGVVHWQERALLSHPRNARLRAMRRMFQDPLGSLNPEVLVLDSVAGAHESLCGSTKAAARLAACNMLEAVGLVGLGVAQRPSGLSAGQRQRAALARALVTQPQVLLADEPVAALDPLAAAALFQLLRREREQRGMAVVIVVHDPTPVPTLADRYVVLHEGRCVDAGPAAELLRSAHPVTRSLCDMSAA
ncbi:MAG: ATP-binding cassette domain-containing protein [Planctomycetes bacterium]|nr:ATP-binding cassette domain-containing protein [Planctomycetota bacterium]